MKWIKKVSKEIKEMPRSTWRSIEEGIQIILLSLGIALGVVFIDRMLPENDINSLIVLLVISGILIFLGAAIRGFHSAEDEQSKEYEPLRREIESLMAKNQLQKILKNQKKKP